MYSTPCSLTENELMILPDHEEVKSEMRDLLAQSLTTYVPSAQGLHQEAYEIQPAQYTAITYIYCVEYEGHYLQ